MEHKYIFANNLYLKMICRINKFIILELILHVYFFPTVNGNKEATKAAETVFTQIGTLDLYDQGTVIHTAMESSSQLQYCPTYFFLLITGEVNPRNIKIIIPANSIEVA